jgi:cyclic beta-1,2-glucan synthetase
VYTQPPYLGRGGWSWYTGAAAWLHRAAVESLFGLHVSGDRLWLLPALPPQWPAAEITVRRDGRSLRLQLVRGAEPLARAVAAGATPLRAGERVAWRQGAQDHTVAGHYVLQLPGG